MWLLNALSLNPKAKHIWSYLEAAWISDKDMESLKSLEHADVRAYESQHNVHGYDDLPEPEGNSYIGSFEKHLLKDSIDNWIQASQLASQEPVQENEPFPQ